MGKLLLIKGWDYFKFTILIFASYGSEIDTTEIILEALRTGKKVYVPKVEGDRMNFYRIRSMDHLRPGYKGIPEPVAQAVIAADNADEHGKSMELYEYVAEEMPHALMIMPGVAFDRENHRVGYGGGFYDRYLEKHPQLERVAVAFSFQMLPEVPTEPTDICPQIVVTEEETCYLTDK